MNPIVERMAWQDEIIFGRSFMRFDEELGYMVHVPLEDMRLIVPAKGRA